MGAARSIVRTVATVALIAVAAPVVGAALVGGAVSATVATAVGAGVISGGLTAIQGGKTSDILKSAIIGGVVAGVGASVSSSVSSSIADAAREAGFTSIADTMGKVVGSAAGSGTSSAISAAARGKDPIEALLSSGISGLVTGGVGATVSSYTADIPGFSDLSKDYGAAGSAIQRAVNTGLTAGMLGKDVEASTLSSLIGSVSRGAGDFLKEGVKDLSDTVRTAYASLTDTGNAVDRNLADQQKAADSYNTLSASLSKQYTEANDALKNYNDAKYGFENYDAKMKADGFTASTDEDGNTTYYKRVGGSYQTRDDGEGGTYQAFVPDGTYKDDEGNPVARTITGPSKDQFFNDANKYAALANDKINAYNEAYKTGTEKLNEYKSTLTALQADQTKLENAFVEQKKTLDTTLADYTAQEKANAEYISKTITDVANAKTEVENALGTPLSEDQIAAFVKTGDIANAAKDYIDIKTTDLGEAQQAALKEGYYFDPNDPELAKQFLGVKNEEETLAALQQFADARATTVQEATDLYKQTYADIYGPDVEVPDPTAEDLLAFMPQVPTDVSGIPKGYQGVAEDVVKGRIQDQFSQDLGFDDYADRTEAQTALGEERPDAATWQDYGKTSGVVDTGGDVYQAGVKSGDVADTREFISPDQIFGFGYDQTAPDQFGFSQTQQVNPADYGPFQQEETAATTQAPDVGVSTDTTAQTQTDGFGFDTGEDDIFGSLKPDDLGVAAGSTTGQAPVDTGLADLGLGTTTEGTASTAKTDQLLTNPEFDKQVADFDVTKYLDTSSGQDVGNIGVQTAAYSPLTTMTDTGAPGDVGLRSLVTQQGGGTSATADDTQEKPTTLTGQNLSEDTSQQDKTQGSDTNIADSTLTTGAPAGTITEKVLGEGADQDVPGGTLTSKYFGDEKKEGADATSLKTNDITSEFKYDKPRPTDEILQSSLTQPNRDQLDAFLAPLRTDTTSLTHSQDAPNTTAATQGLNMDEDNFDWDSWDRAVEDYVNQQDASKGGADDGVLRTPDGVDESFLDRLSPEERDRYLAMQDPNYKAPDYGVQDLGISQQNIDEFNNNFNPAGGFSSGWQVVGNDRIFVNDDGTGIGMDENGNSYSLSVAEVKAMINNGLLNTAGSGYVAATGGTGNTPGGSGGAGGGKGGGGGGGGGGKGGNTSTTGNKVIDKIIDAATTPRGLAALAGAIAGPAIAPKGISPMGLRGIQGGTGKQLVQTGAKGTGGKGGVRYFEKKAGGGTVGGLGYLKSAHDGMADQIDATIDNKRPAKLSGGEFVIPADVVSHLGNGNSEAGAKQLYDLMARIRKERTGTTKQGKQINPKKYLG